MSDEKPTNQSTNTQAPLHEETRGLGLIELIAGIGEDRVRIQNLLESATGLRSRKHGFTEVSFLTKEITPNAGLGQGDTVGIVMWLPMADAGAIHAEHRAGIVRPQARLIAAAPDLLAAAKAVEETCPCDRDINARFDAAWGMLLAAIAKAEGK